MLVPIDQQIRYKVFIKRCLLTFKELGSLFKDPKEILMYFYTFN